MDSKDLLSLLKEPLFFDDWVAANFKAINLSSDWLAAQQSPYQILGGDPEALRPRAGRASRARAGSTRRHAGRPFVLAFGCPCLGGRVPLHYERPSSSSHGRCGRPPERLSAGLPPGQCCPGRREQVGLGSRDLCGYFEHLKSQKDLPLKGAPGLKPRHTSANLTTNLVCACVAYREGCMDFGGYVDVRVAENWVRVHLAGLFL